MKIDLHVHSSERSACGKAGEEEQIRAAIAAGLDALVFTDHGKLVPESRLRQLNQEYAPFRVFSGIEISLGEDILVFGINDRELEIAQWTYPELHSFVREQEGYMILAHPYRYHPTLYAEIDQFPPNGIEIYSNNTPVSWQPHIHELSQKLNLTLFSNSDAHKTSVIGAFYNDIPGSPETDRELLQALNDGPVILSSLLQRCS
jgi:predicted metal-dependent phosphoesterase TrpH